MKTALTVSTFMDPMGYCSSILKWLTQNLHTAHLTSKHEYLSLEQELSSWLPHTSHVLWQKQIHEWEGLSLCYFFWEQEGQARYLNVCFYKIKFISIVWYLGTLREFLPLIILKCVTKTAEEVAARGLCSRCAVSREDMVCTEHSCCFVAEHSSIFGSDTTSKTVLISCANYSYIYYSLSIQFPLSLLLGFG